MSPKDVVRRLYEAGSKGAIDTFLSLVSDDVVNEPVFLPHGGTYRGKDELLSMFGTAAAVIDSSTKEIESITASGDRVFAVIAVALTDGKGNAVLGEQYVVTNGVIAEITVFVHRFDTVATAA